MRENTGCLFLGHGNCLNLLHLCRCSSQLSIWNPTFCIEQFHSAHSLLAHLASQWHTRDLHEKQPQRLL
ncbi:hypothetical protein KIL84_022691 [Mauremys mutica]|uniref:Uncharacterized protein n=1 Tax=Mauremys mutica TaxID=74926 RepID=A0A9D4ALN3_9SAUR|nr:hypothetical protein KIL84_022691 [Mauremys mutica]